MALSNISNIVIVAFIVIGISHVTFAQKGLNSNKDILNAHNKARAEVGVPPLHWNKTVEAYALNYAKTRTGNCELEHSMGPLYGENLAGGGGDMATVDGVNMWVEEKRFYNPKTNSCQGDECRHYTAVVWRKSTSVGCARVKCQNGGVFIICNYYPMGNIVGERAY